MRRLRFVLGVGFVTLSLVLVACSEDDDDAKTGSCEALGGQVPSAECESCTQTYCGDEYSSFCGSGCTTTDTSVSCQQTVGAVVACVLSSCADACSSLTGSGGEAGTTTESNFSCHYADQGLCSSAAVTASTREPYERACADTGGVQDDTCPTEALTGCCSYAGGTRTCVYETTAPALDRDSCGESGGSWGDLE